MITLLMKGGALRLQLAFYIELEPNCERGTAADPLARSPDSSKTLCETVLPAIRRTDDARWKNFQNAWACATKASL